MKPTKQQIEAARRKQLPIEGGVSSDEEYRKRLSDEYKMLQDKIDKIGAFRFTIKGWSVTVVIAASAAGANTSSLLATVLISIAASVMLIFFFYLEVEQVNLSRLFGGRAGRLESQFRKLERGKGQASGQRLPVHYTAHEVALHDLFAGAKGDVQERKDALRKTRKQAHLAFYSVLVVFSLLMSGTKYAAIGKDLARVKPWLEIIHQRLDSDHRHSPPNELRQ